MRITVMTVAIALSLAVARAGLAQQHAHADGHAADTVAPVHDRISERARRQIRAVEEAVQHLDSPAAAREAGFRPALGWIPAMGTHWVNSRRVADGIDMLEPDHLMFSPVDGTPTLVGVAYAFRGPLDAPLPDGFDGALDVWHDHRRLAPAGETLHMLHVWFVESPDGPFAGHNPWLPFYAVGLTPPDTDRLRDPAAAERIRALAAALASTVETTWPDRLLTRFGGEALVERVERRRGATRDLVPRLRHAQAVGDTTAWDRLAAQAVEHWEAIRGAYLEAVPTERGRDRLARRLDRMMGGGGHH